MSCCSGVRFIMPGVKFPFTRNGAAILANDEYKSRIELFDGTEIPSLSGISDQLQFTVFNQPQTYPDLVL